MKGVRAIAVAAMERVKGAEMVIVEPYAFWRLPNWCAADRPPVKAGFGLLLVKLGGQDRIQGLTGRDVRRFEEARCASKRSWGMVHTPWFGLRISCTPCSKWRAPFVKTIDPFPNA